jgi:hypothetical protein
VKFDRFDDEAVAVQTEVLPDGDHVCEITAEKEWADKDGSREATIVTFTPVNGAPAFDKFFDPSQERDTKDVRQLLAALGLPADHDLGKGTLKGKRVTVTTKRATDKVGEPKFDKRTGLQTLWLNGFKPAAQATEPAAAGPKPVWKENAEQQQAKAAAKRTASQKATATLSEPDDIPF